jgi:hypothetical protein
MDLRKSLMQVGDNPTVPLVGPLMMQPPHDVHLGATVVGRFPTPGEDLLVAHRIPLRVPKVAAKGAKAATVDANVGRVEVRVDVVIPDVAIQPLANLVGKYPDLLQRDPGVVEEDSVIQAQTLAGFDLVANASQTGTHLARNHREVLKRYKLSSF